MKEPGHYSVHCQEQVREYAQALRAEGQSKDAVFVENLAAAVLDSPKFTLDGYTLFREFVADLKWRTEPHTLRLPFENVVLETSLPMLTAPGNTPSDRSVVLLQEKDGAIYVTAISRIQVPSKGWRWVPLWVGARIAADFVPMQDLQELPGHVPGVSFEMTPVLRHDEMSDLAQSKDELTRCMAVDIMSEIQTVFGFFWALEQRRAVIERCPAPVKLNKKRVARGALPFDDYHVLSLHLSAPTGERSGGAQTLIERLRPREHQRAGHWRHYKSGKQVWIKQMTVNAGVGGVVWKDYRVSL